jgi:hypothetical protein
LTEIAGFGFMINFCTELRPPNRTDGVARTIDATAPRLLSVSDDK